jgi:hypothetical protein
MRPSRTLSRDVARGDEIAAHLGIKIRPLRRSVAEQMMPKRVESGVRMLHGPSGSPPNVSLSVWYGALPLTIRSER